MCSTIMNLLSLANEDSVPGADDFVPVLVFVLIKVGPRYHPWEEFLCHPDSGGCAEGRQVLTDFDSFTSFQLSDTQEESS